MEPVIMHVLNRALLQTQMCKDGTGVRRSQLPKCMSNGFTDFATRNGSNQQTE